GSRQDPRERRSFGQSAEYRVLPRYIAPDTTGGERRWPRAGVAQTPAAAIDRTNHEIPGLWTAALPLGRTVEKRVKRRYRHGRFRPRKYAVFRGFRLRRPVVVG